MRKINFVPVGEMLFLFSLFTFTISSCNDDNEPLYQGRGMLSTQTQGNSPYVILLDNGSRLYPEESYLHPSKVKDSLRLEVYFNILEETEEFSYKVKITYADTILTKPILPYEESLLDSVGNDPVKISQCWFAHGFLNFEFLFAGRYNISSSSAHMVNLLRLPDENGKLIFEFRHNDFGDYRDKMYVGVISFPIHTLLEKLEKPVTLEIRYRDSENTTRSVEMVYK